VNEFLCAPLFDLLAIIRAQIYYENIRNDVASAGKGCSAAIHLHTKRARDVHGFKIGIEGSGEGVAQVALNTLFEFIEHSHGHLPLLLLPGPIWTARRVSVTIVVGLAYWCRFPQAWP